MRAARVLDMLLLLQRRGRLTARDLATALEVSERTVLRDVEALSEAGVPIYASQGAGGGIELLDGFETRLTGLTFDEARSLFLVGQPRVAHRLGLAASARSVRLKLAGAVPAALADQADSLDAWFLHDPDPWAGNTIPHGELRRIGRCIREHRRLELTFADGVQIRVKPLGLVLKAGSWHLVHVGDPVDPGNPVHPVDPAEPRKQSDPPPPLQVLGLDGLRATRLTTQRFEPPPGFSLDHFWSARLARMPPIPT